MTEAFVQEFEARAGTATAEGPEWLEPVRRAAMERFSRTGFPAARDEEWRFTPLGAIAQGAWRPVTGGAGELTRAQLAPFVFGHADWSTLVFVNGVFNEGLSTVGEMPAGVRVSSLAEALRSDGAMLHAHLTRHAPVEGSPGQRTCPRQGSQILGILVGRVPSRGVLQFSHSPPFPRET